jgi:hypothetical protein
MAASDDPKLKPPTETPPPSTAVTGAPPIDASSPAGVSVASPAPEAAPRPKKPPLTAEQYNKLTARLDSVLVLLVLAFAFLAGSFAIRNSDFFLHLATGRSIAQGDYEIGKDPFAFTSDGVRWVNHSWLYCLGLYGLHGLGEAGAVVMIVLKSLALTMLAAVMIGASRSPGQRVFVPACCVAVAMLAISARVLLQPVVLSYLFLGVTVLILRWPHLWKTEGVQAPSSRCYWLLPPLFALWVNCDQWFFLGPVTAGLYWLGEYLQDALETDRGKARPGAELPTLGYATLAGVAACLLNPHHVFAFTLPAQLGLSDVSAALAKDEQLKILFLSPLDFKDYWTTTNGLSASGLAFVPLFLAGLISFGVNYQSLRWSRALVFAAFAMLSLYHARAVPFFAVVAAPITSLNFLDLAARLVGPEVEPESLRPRWGAGRAAALLAAAALVVCCVAGWTQPRPHERYHLGWALYPDVSLERACKKIDEWQNSSLLEADARWFNLSPDVVNYMAWYCPKQRGFLDLRLALFDDCAHDYVEAREDFIGKHLKENQQTREVEWTSGKWQTIFEKHKVDYLIIHSNDPYRLGFPLRFLLEHPKDWTPYSVDGHTLVFAYNKSRGDSAEAQRRREGLRFDLRPAAFGKDTVRAPRTPPQEAELKWYAALWQAYWKATPPRAQEVDDAVVYVMYSEIVRQLWEKRQIDVGQRLQARDIQLANAGLCVGMGIPAAFHLNKPPLFDRAKYALEPRPTDPGLYVALRGLRQSIHDNPNDPVAYVRLGQAYLSLFWNTPEHDILKRSNFYQIGIIRQAQVAGAAHKALQLNPELDEPHLLFVQWYAQCMQHKIPCFSEGNISVVFIDAPLRHRRELLRSATKKLQGMSKTGDPNADALVDQQERAVKQLEQEIDKMDADLQKELNLYEIEAGKPGLSVLQLAFIALSHGLGDKALELFRTVKQDDPLFKQGPDAVRLAEAVEIKLMLALGEVDEPREMLAKAQETWPVRMLPQLVELQLLLAAASGDYEKVDELLAKMKPTLDSAAKVEAVQQCARLTYPPAGPNWFAALADFELSYLLLEADVQAVRGWMALEAGDIPEARKNLWASLQVAAPPERNLALYAAVGPGVPEEKARYAGTGGGMTLRSRQLAEWNLYQLESVPANAR